MLITVSSRLPVTARAAPGGLELVESVGGVATGLRGIPAVRQGWWVGWPGSLEAFEAGARREVIQGLEALSFQAVELSPDEVRGFYLGYSNGVVWPLFHYLIDQIPLRSRYWETYERVNQRFAAEVAARYRPGDLVWVHDYQLMRVPVHLRRLVPDARIGFFLHIPFPSYEVFRILPARQEILEGLLGADLIGFHTAGYAEHFTRAASRLLGAVPLEEGRLASGDRTVTVGPFPMGVDVTRFECEPGASPFTRRESLRDNPDEKILVGIDRLDYTKGIPRRLLAFEQLLCRHPDLRERVALIQVAVPSRSGVRAYRRFRRQVNALVGRINGTFGTPHWTPVRYLTQRFSQADLLALLRGADVMLVTPVRDGMNLVAKEFIASRVDGDGVLVLSEFTGAAAELMEAVLVNPYHVDGTAEAYYRALVMPAAERRARMKALRTQVLAHPVEHWAQSFVDALGAAPGREEAPGTAGTAGDAIAAAQSRIRAAAAVELLLDYDGTLVPFAPSPDLAQADPELLDLLERLSRRPGTRVHIISGRPREVLEAWFGAMPVSLHAEHGAWSRDSADSAWRRHASAGPVPYDALLRVLNRYTAATPGSVIERKAMGLAWHFRLAPGDRGPAQAERLIQEIQREFAGQNVEVLRGEKVVEFRPAGVHKGLIVTRLLREVGRRALLVALGDDLTDEDMFAALPSDGVAIHVGSRASATSLRLPDVGACRRFLGDLVGPAR